MLLVLASRIAAALAVLTSEKRLTRLGPCDSCSCAALLGVKPPGPNGLYALGTAEEGLLGPSPSPVLLVAACRLLIAVISNARLSGRDSCHLVTVVSPEFTLAIDAGPPTVG